MEEARLRSPNDDVVPDDGTCRGGPASRKRAWWCVILAMTLPFCGAVFYFAILKQSLVAKVLYACVKVFTVVWPVVAVYLLGVQRRSSVANDANRRLRALPLGAISGLVIGGAIIALMNFGPVHDYVTQMAPRLRDRLEFFGIHSLGTYIAWCVFLAGLHSLIEEFFWRWFVFGTLRTLVSRNWAFFLASLSFALHHYVICWQYVSPVGALVFGTGVGLGGLIWCWMVERQGTLTGAWLSHALVDAGIFVVGYQLLFA